MKHQQRNLKYFWLAVGLFGFFIAGVLISVSLGAARRITQIRSQAAAAPVVLSFTQEAGAGGTKQVVLHATTAENIAFAEIHLSFDPKILQLTGDIFTTPSLSTVNSKTSRVAANSDGKIMISLGLAVSDKANPPHGTFEVARLPFGALNSTSGSISIDAAQSYFVNLSAKSLAVNPAVVVVGSGSGSTVVVPTPTVAPLPSGIPNPPSWWAQAPKNLKDFIDLIYIWVFYFHKTSGFIHLLDGIVPIPTPQP